MPKFQMYSDDKTLTKEVGFDGCGLTQQEADSINPEQKGNYWFSWHNKYHGDGGRHYVYVHTANPPRSNIFRIFIDDAEDTAGNPGDLKGRDITNAQAVVDGNRALFNKMLKNLKYKSS
jgi:hypothetical protein